MDHEPLYFTWPDRRFGHDCRSCGACCKGLGIGLDAAGGQVARLLEIYPAMLPFLRKRGGTWTAFNPRGRCWFLDGEGLCRIERDHGRARKPAACRLFPFNRVFRVGDFLVVDYNSVVCPLVDGMGNAVAHESVLAEIDQIADSAVVGIELAADPPNLILRERDFAKVVFDACAAPYVELEVIWRAQRGTPDLGAALAGLARASEVVFGQPLGLPVGELLRRALLLTPSLRFNELYGPRQYAPRAELVEALPRVWLAWLGFVNAGAALAGRDLSLQEATSTWAEEMPLCYLLARWHERPHLRPGPFELPPAHVDPGNLIRQLGEACIKNHGKQSLGQLVTPLFEAVAFADRIALARMFEPILGRLRFADDRFVPALR